MASDVGDDERLRARERPAGRPAMRQIWQHLGFLHWPVARDAIARLLPPGLDVDVFDGAAYVGIVPFTIPLTRTAGSARRWRPRSTSSTCGRTCTAAAAIPASGSSASTPPAGWPSRARGSRTGCRTFTPTSRSPRRAPPSTTARAGAVRRPRSPPATSRRARSRPPRPGSLEFFLAERYLLYSAPGRGLRTARVHHTPYPLQVAAAADVEQTLTSVAGLPACAGPPALIHYAREVDVAIFSPRAALTTRARSDRSRASNFAGVTQW